MKNMRIFALAMNNNTPGRKLRLFAAAKKSNVLELFFYDVIGQDWYGEGITASSVQKSIKEAGEFTAITVHLNSPGGDSFEGIAIHNILRQQGVPVTVIVEGLAASAAFTIAMSGDLIKVAEASMMMLHNAWSIAIGNASEMRKMADLLEKHDGTLNAMYSKRSGLGEDEVKALCDAETWLTADEAIAKGFATEKLETTPEASKEARARASAFDLSKFAKVPETLKSETSTSEHDAVEHELAGMPDAAAIANDLELRRRQLELAMA